MARALPYNSRRLLRISFGWPLRMLLIIAILCFFIFYNFPIIGPNGSSFNRDENAIWLAHHWVEEYHTNDEIGALAHTLRSEGIRYAFAHIGPLEAGGIIPPERYARAKIFVTEMHRAEPDLKVLAWIGGLNSATGGDIDLTDPHVRSQIVAIAGEVCDQDGFDGVHYNIEGLPTGRTDFLQLLDETRTRLGKQRMISIAGIRWQPSLPGSVPLTKNLTWTSDYYREVAARSDQIAVMLYDTSMPTVNLFILFVRLQTDFILRACGDSPEDHAHLLIGVPNYKDNTRAHRPGVERIDTALQGVALALQESPIRTRFDGVAIYAHWEMDSEEWQLYNKIWRGRDG